MRLTEQDIIKIVKPETILNIVADYYKIPADVIKNNCNRSEIVKPRYIAIYYCRTKTNLKVVEIANNFNYKDHSSIIYAYKSVLKMERFDSAYRQELKEIGTLISNTEIYDEEKLYGIFQENDCYYNDKRDICETVII